MSHGELFELGGAYDRMLRRGIALAGESADYFIDGRVDLLRTYLLDDAAISSILDFGCGVGDTSARLADAFGATVTGVDVAAGAVDEARRRVDHGGVRFALLADLPDVRFDLCYVNCAYHHIPPSRWLGITRRIFARLRPGGVLALFENNPWSLPARTVMRRIPFDGDAVMLRPATALRLLRNTGFVTARTDYLFFFPRILGPLRSLEPSLRRVSLGAQYLVVARRP